MATQKGSGAKGNPAHKRMGNEQLKRRRRESWQRGQASKTARRTAAAERERANHKRRMDGEPTPWEAAKAARKARRALIS